jgi:hypothetical protein
MNITTKSIGGTRCGLFVTIKGKHFNLYWNKSHEIWWNNHKLYPNIRLQLGDFILCSWIAPKSKFIYKTTFRRAIRKYNCDGMVYDFTGFIIGNTFFIGHRKIAHQVIKTVVLPNGTTKITESYYV